MSPAHGVGIAIVILTANVIALWLALLSGSLSGS